jgi:organic hydroperoxide reductase OsmC/OhrA
MKILAFKVSPNRQSLLPGEILPAIDTPRKHSKTKETTERLRAMTDKTHQYHAQIAWTGAGDKGTKNYKSYDRLYDVNIEGKPTMAGSSDPAFRGDPARHNPEDMLVTSVSSCHMLWYLHICSVSGVVVTSYVDNAVGVMAEVADGSGYFTKITLKPKITITTTSDMAKAKETHAKANKMCFIANTLNCPVEHEPIITQK